ncbi:4-oxalocrotonate tautomerase DmpI [Seleniivibrio sp.]|uniref:4-oxalocrotonate tautomerase DmpI n=1 Tax=Seleniivibrio sp. TaxID=2898801 RepID=UPI0025D20E48|nr:4-oxalocrotonate tautomerase DmpI [Seleniivibrio sp.]MCD8552784.1 tautomerase family protein [Seleniivibrio sp.]
MPVITIQMGKMTVDKKKEFVEKITAAASEITQIPSASFVVFVDEYDYESIGVGGQTLAEKRAGK